MGKSHILSIEQQLERAQTQLFAHNAQMISRTAWMIVERDLAKSAALTNESKAKAKEAEANDANERARKLADLNKKDFLTGIYNRRYLESILEQAIQNINDSQKSKGLLDNRLIVFVMMDIDHFKKYNDEQGHAVGDEVLKTTSVNLAHTVRDEQFGIRYADIAARWGGDEFAALLIVDASEHIGTVVQRILDNQTAYPCTVGVIALTGQEIREKNITLDGITHEADKLLYVGKKHGRNCAAIKVGMDSTQTTIIRPKNATASKVEVKTMVVAL